MPTHEADGHEATRTIGDTLHRLIARLNGRGQCLNLPLKWVGLAEGELIRGMGTPGQRRVGGRACVRPRTFLRSTRGGGVRLVAASAAPESGELKAVTQQWHNEHQVRCDLVTSLLLLSPSPAEPTS